MTIKCHIYATYANTTCAHMRQLCKYSYFIWTQCNQCSSNLMVEWTCALQLWIKYWKEKSNKATDERIPNRIKQEMSAGSISSKCTPAGYDVTVTSSTTETLRRVTPSDMKDAHEEDLYIGKAIRYMHAGKKKKTTLAQIERFKSKYVRQYLLQLTFKNEVVHQTFENKGSKYH